MMPGPTTQAQRPGARDATIATATLSPGSLQRMVELSRYAASCFPGIDLDQHRSAASRRQFITIMVHEKHQKFS
jgi:hypothetical protein